MCSGLAFAVGAVSVGSAYTRLLESYHFTAALIELLDCLVKLIDRKRHLAAVCSGRAFGCGGSAAPRRLSEAVCRVGGFAEG